MNRRFFFGLLASPLVAKVAAVLPAPIVKARTDALTREMLRTHLDQEMARSLATVYYNKKALEDLKKNFKFSAAFREPRLPFNPVKKIEFFRYGKM